MSDAMDPPSDRRPDMAWIGRAVTVVIDRPLGSRHPRHRALVYPVNYGYVPGTRARDGDEIDAYVLGPTGPVARFDGVVIALLHRRDDVEDKLVVAAPGVAFTDAEIHAAVDFQERFFDTVLLRGAGPTP